ncbi:MULTISPECIES: hypothetical protein [Shewanella]|uniref:hypothetical protein n=1 Tax=Shewanella TaxID=22 RepID=UPI001C660BFF|nr:MULTISPECIES: hypothetical protein [Shewanella]QYJ83254.1 hypothetical protein K0H80_04300 [Shewanella aegiceratis]QYJ94620.1 hypothetical protein K0I31_04315 [Shewanella spartinae]
MKQSLWVLLSLLVSIQLQAGQVVVRKSSEPFDAFAVRDKVQQDFEWRESLRLQQQIQILQSLPLGCVLFKSPYAYYRCGASFYRPYLYQTEGLDPQQLYIQVDPPVSQ